MIKPAYFKLATLIFALFFASTGLSLAQTTNLTRLNTVTPTTSALLPTVSVPPTATTITPILGTLAPLNTGATTPSTGSTTTTPSTGTTPATDGTVTTAPSTTGTAPAGSSAGTTAPAGTAATTGTTGQNAASTPGTRAPVGTFVPPAVPTTTPTATPEAPSCPPINPLSSTNVQCPKTEVLPVIPQLPYILIITPVLGLLLFWLVLSQINRGQIGTENRLRKKRLATTHAQTVIGSRTSLYREMLEYLSGSLDKNNALDPEKMRQFSARLALVGTPEMQKLHSQLTAACAKHDRPETKRLLKDFALQIRKEL